jgi:hypothetical protein
MKVGPLDLPVSNASQIIGFAVLTVAIIAVVRMLPLPASVAKYKP